MNDEVNFFLENATPDVRLHVMALRLYPGLIEPSSFSNPLRV